MSELGPEDLRSLASLVRSGFPVRAALEEVGTQRPGMARIGYRVRMGAGPRLALHGEGATGEAAGLIDLHERTGGNLATMLDGAAERIEAKRSARASAASASSGALLSMKLIAALPFLWLPVSAKRGMDLIDGMLIGAGLLLGGIGWAWMTRLVPRPPAPDLAEQVMSTTSHLLSGGAGMQDAIALALSVEDRNPWVASVRARHLLGAPWVVAMGDHAPTGMLPFIEVVARCERSGEASASAISELARRRREEIERIFDRRLKRAPVLMVLPLGLCVLPSFLLVAVGPTLRSFTG